MKFGNNILKYKDEILSDLNTLIEFESIAQEKPEECQKAIDFILKRATDFGLINEQVTNKSAHITLGNIGKLCGVLSHLDVVPAGNNWSVIPYALTEKDGRLYGRGVADDKGAALINLYCLRAIKESDVKGKNTLRAIYGTTEECGMEDMDSYFQKMPIPDMSFTPDSDYGVCCGEKGILQLKVGTPNNTATLLSQFHSGKAVNAVPDLAYAMIDSSSYDEQTLMRLADASDGDFEFNYTIDGLMIISRGKAAHACTPSDGYNAATSLINLIANAYQSAEMGPVCEFIDYAVGMETNGRSLGLKMSDAQSGDLTVNVGTVHIEEDKAYATLDIRYPISVKGDNILKQFKKVAKHSNLSVDVLHHEKPLNVSPDSELIKILRCAYKNVTGNECDIYATGGGTYARKLGSNGVAFGPAFKDDNTRMHNSDESIDKEKFFTHAQICCEAMYLMYTEG